MTPAQIIFVTFVIAGVVNGFPQKKF